MLSHTDTDMDTNIDPASINFSDPSSPTPTPTPTSTSTPSNSTPSVDPSSEPVYQSTHRITFTATHGTFNFGVSDYDTGHSILPSPQLRRLGEMFIKTKRPGSTWAQIGGLVSWYNTTQAGFGAGCQLELRDPHPACSTGAAGSTGTVSTGSMGPTGGVTAETLNLPVGNEFQVIVRQRVQRGHQYSN